MIDLVFIQVNPEYPDMTPDIRPYSIPDACFNRAASRHASLRL